MEFTIRPAQEKDLPAVYELICQLEETIFEYTEFRHVFKENLRNPSCVYLVAEACSRGVAAFAGLHIQNLLHHCGKVAEIQEFVVGTQCRRMGIGGRLLQAAEWEAVARHCHSLEVTANRKRHRSHLFYAAHGLKGTHKKFVKTLAVQPVAVRSLVV